MARVKKITSPTADADRSSRKDELAEAVEDLLLSTDKFYDATRNLLSWKEHSSLEKANMDEFKGEAYRIMLGLLSMVPVLEDLKARL